MKKLLFILFAGVAMVVASSCADDSSSNDGKGSVTFSVKGISTRAAEAITDEEAQLVERVLPNLSFRIYSIIDRKETFIRSYTGSEIKDMKIWLVPGKYKVVVEGGAQVPATFDRGEVYYYGSKKFDVKMDNDDEVSVTCYPQNVMIRIRYDQSVKDLVSSGDLTEVCTTVAIADAVDKMAESTTSLQYKVYMEDVEENGEVVGQVLKEPTIGYFTFEEEQKSIAWEFSAKDVAKGNKVINRKNVYTPKDDKNQPTGFLAGYVYTLTFKYSPDLGGYVSLSVSADKSETEYNDVVEFKPAPQFSGQPVNRTVAVYKGMGGLEYTIKAINPMKSVKVLIGTEEITAGVVIDEANEKEWKLTLGDEFIAKLAAGDNKFSIVAEDNANAKTSYLQYYKGEGAYDMTVIDTWNGKATLKAYVNNPEVNSGKFFYRKKGTSDWSEIDMTVENGIGSANIESGIIGNTDYEFYLSYGTNDDRIGPNANHYTTAKPIPNGGMEEWSGSFPMLPYSDKIYQFWDCGNHGSTSIGSLGGKNVTTKVSAPRPESSGSYSAKLDSEEVVIAFAAGNIYVGNYLGTEGANGGIGYGKPFEFDYKPTKLTVWYRGKVGDVTHDKEKVIPTKSDKSQIFVWLCNSEDQYMVYTDNKGTFINADGTYANALDSDFNKFNKTVPKHNSGDKVKGLVAWGSWSRTQTGVSVNGSVETTDINGDVWTKIEIPLQYVGTDKPNYLVISCAASAYGDYFAGSTDSYMYVDDFEFVY